MTIDLKKSSFKRILQKIAFVRAKWQKKKENLPLCFIPNLLCNAFNFMCLVCIYIEEVFETRELPVVACEEGPDQRILFLF